MPAIDCAKVKLKPCQLNIVAIHEEDWLLPESCLIKKEKHVEGAFNSMELWSIILGPIREIKIMQSIDWRLLLVFVQAPDELQLNDGQSWIF